LLVLGLGLITRLATFIVLGQLRRSRSELFARHNDLHFT